MTLPEHEKVASSTTTTDTDRTQVRDNSDAEAHHGDLKKLEGLSGTEFDRAFAKMAVKDHEKDLADFEKQAKNGSDPDVKQFAEKTSTVVRKHLDLAKEIQGKLK